MILSPLYEKPNTIRQKQQKYQTDHRHITRRLPRSSLYLTVYGAGWVVGMVGTVYGITSLIKGKKTE
ncbi:hypothetical protein BDN72DRAFT_836760 [Pluteus cervinus]|uniref:Uncharacterized protein n=1 Tax=Pluteus cervinus TaxID=181527 RepID=A0ACD3B1Z1_9AGAR|nr:hypothetical protein BDN72DRAFT_836760 [Pluteus cervinus]